MSRLMFFHDGEPGECPDSCSLCDDAFPQSNNIVKDHCHRCRYFRGWLCEVCNSYIGEIEYDPKKRERWIKRNPEKFWWIERVDFYLGAHFHHFR